MQNLWKWLFETVFVLTLVLVSFLTIFTVLNFFFPSGQSFFQLIREVGGVQPSLASLRKDTGQISVGMGDSESDLGTVSTMTAFLTEMNNNVKSRRSTEIAWSEAAPGMKLYDRDAVQTGRRSSAKLTFGRNNHIYMDENSLLMIRSLERDIFLNTGRTVAVLVEGQFRGEIGRPEQGSVNVDLVTAGAVARFPAPGKGSEPASFKMVVNRDESSVLTVYQGQADILFQGRELEVGANQIVKVKPGEKPVFLPPPPLPPDLALPEDGEVFPFRDASPRVSFAWIPAENSLRYRFVLARDAQFEDIVYERVTDKNTFSHGNLKAGEYYWHVSALGPEEEGGYSLIRRLNLVQDLEPPALKVNLPSGPLNSGDLLLSGTTDPDADLFVNGMPASVKESGDFEVGLELRRGWNVIVLEAVDQVGNVAYFSSTLNVQY